MKHYRLTAVLCAALMLTAVPAAPFAPMQTATISVHAEDTEKLTEGDYTYTANDGGGLTITKYNGTDTAVTIPAEIGSVPVTAIGLYPQRIPSRR